MFMSLKSDYCENVNFSQLELQIQLNPNQNSSKLFYRYQHTDSEVDMVK